MTQIKGASLLDYAALRESVELETRADLLAHACNFGEAALLMKGANALRQRQFGHRDPNELRELTAAALRARAQQ